MSVEQILSEKYARALLSSAREQGNEEEVLAGMDLAAGVFGRGEARALLLNPLVGADKKIFIVKAILEKRVTPLTLSFLRLLIEKRRGVLITGIAAAYRAAWEQVQGRRNARMTSAIPITPEQSRKLREQLSKLCGTEVELQQVVDKDLGAGGRIEMGNLLWDGTIKNRLAQLRRAMLTGN